VDTKWLTDDELRAWMRLVAVVELLPGALDAQLRRDAELSHYEYYVLAILSEAPHRTLRMTAIASRTNATLPRLSHVARRLEDWTLCQPAAPGHVANVREHVIDALTPEQVEQLSAIAATLLRRLDPEGTFALHAATAGQEPTGS
jgi:hypothetical protein